MAFTWIVKFLDRVAMYPLELAERQIDQLGPRLRWAELPRIAIIALLTGVSLILNRGGEGLHGAEPSSSLWENREFSETFRRIPPWNRATSCIWRKAPLWPLCGDSSPIAGSG